MRAHRIHLAVAQAILAGGLGWLAPGAQAHTLPISFLTLVPAADYLHLELTLNPFELSFFAELDRNKNGRLDVSEWEDQQAEITRQILQCLTLRVDGKHLEPEVAGLTPDLDSHHATVRAHYRVDARYRPVSLTSTLATLTSGSHFSQVTFGAEGRTQAARLDTQSGTVTFKPWADAPLTEPTPASSAPQALSWWWLALPLGALAVLLGCGWRWRHRLRTPCVVGCCGTVIPTQTHEEKR